MLNKKYSNKLIIAARQKIKEKNYWLKNLAGIPGKSNFPYDCAKKENKRTAAKSFAGETCQFPGELFSQLMKLGRGDERALHVILTAGIILTLNKYTGQTDIVVGTPIYKQESDAEFLNTVLALRTQADENMTFKDLVLRVKETIIAAAEHYSYPLGLLADQWGAPDEEDEFPFFDTMLLLENLQDRSYIRDIQPNMLFIFSRTGASLQALIEYNPSLYKKSSILRIGRHYQNLLSQVVFDVDQPLADVEVLSKEEKKQLLIDFNDTAAEYPKGKTIHKLFAEQVKRTPDNIALVGEMQSAERKAQSIERNKERHAPCALRCALTYRELNKKSNQLAQRLQAQGIQPDTIVGIVIERSIEMVTGILAVLKAGGAYLPINRETPRDRIVSMLTDCQAPVLLATTRTAKTSLFTHLQGLSPVEAEPFVTGPRPQIRDFDGLSIPDRTLVNYKKYNQYIGQAMVKNSISLQGTRGCPYHCAYCHIMWSRNHVFRSAENIFSELLLYYQLGVRRFSFVDDVFNLDRDNSKRFFRLIIENGLDVMLFFPNGLRGDILTPAYIDLMVNSGVRNFALALETASPRLQKLIGKNMNLEKLRENIEYIVEKHPNIILELFTMHGLPTETEEEAMMTLDFIKSIKWLHFPYINILTIYPGTEIEKLALKNGVSRRAIDDSDTLAHHDLPDTLTFDKHFTVNYQMRFLDEYFLSGERLLHVLPYQMRILTEDEMVKKYNSYLPVEAANFNELLKAFEISIDQLDVKSCISEDYFVVPHLDEKIGKCFPAREPLEDALRVLLMDLSQFFTDESSTVYDVVEPPLGAMYVMTYLQKRFGSGINGKIIKSRIDFDNYPDLKARLDEFKPEIIGIRTLTFYKNFFHKVVSMIRQWGIDVPVIAGGPYAASGYPTLLQDRNVDLAVLGEGELTFSELIEKIIDNNKKLPGKDVLKQIPGIAFIHDREVSRKGFPLQKREVMMLDMINTRAQPAANPGHTARCMDLASIIYTSGSTGKPKGVMIEHGNVVNVVEWFTRRYNVHRDTPVLLLSDYTFDASMNQIFAALLHGAPLYVPPGEMLSDIEALRRYVEANRIYLINFIPGLLKELLCHGPKIESIRHIISGGDRLDEEIKDRIIEKGYILHNQYGPTEITIDALVSRCTPGKVVLGKPIANVKCYLLNKNNTIVPIGVPGEIYVAGHGVTRGYLNNPELTAQKYRSYGSYRSYKTYKSYQTGDLGRWLPDGNIEFLGRIDHQVKIRGYRIELGEIENRILKKQGIDQAVVLDKKDQKGGAYLCAYIRANKTFESSELAEFLAKDLPAYMIPAYFIPVEKIPLAANGKIDRKALPEPGIKVKPGHISPANKTEKTLAGIWSEVLGVDKAVIGIDSNFFQLGGQSLSATILISKVHRVFDVKLTLMEIFKSPSIKELADHIKTAKEERYLAVEPAEAREYYVLSAPQKRLYILQQIEKNTVHYNVTTALELEGAADMERLTGTFKKLIQRHESFRTSFVLLDEVPYQHIHEPDEVEFEIEYKEVEVEVEEEEEPFGQINAFGEEAKGHHSSFIIHHSFIIRPFDLSQAPLLRVGLIRLAANRHILVLDINHIIVDGASVGIFVKDFMALYKGDELPPLKTRYRDYAQWQNSKRQRHRIKSQEDYWLRQFATEIPALNLTLDYPRPAIQCFEGSELFFQVEAERTKALKALALEEEASLYMVLLAIFTILLSKLSRQEDIVVGTPTAGRRHAALDNIIGMLVNTLPMRNFPAKTYTFKEFLNEVKQNALDAFENQDYPFEELVDKAVPTRDSSRNPIFDILFVFQNMEIPEAEIPGMKLKPYQIEHNISPFDLYLNAEEAGDKLHFTFCFCTRLFKEKKIRRFIGYFQDIISHVIENIDIRLADIKISHELKEKKLNIPQQVREGFNF